MSDILANFMTSNKVLNGASRFLNTQQNDIRLMKYGLFLSDNNIIKIPNPKETKKSNYSYLTNTFSTNFSLYNKINSQSISPALSSKKNRKFNLSKAYKSFKNKKLKEFLKINDKKLISQLQMDDPKNIFSDLTNDVNPKKLINNSVNIKRGVDYFLPNKNKNKSDLNRITQIPKILNKITKDKKIMNQLYQTDAQVDFLKKKIIQNRTKFPKNKSISPATYIKFNFQNYPNDKSLFRSIKSQLKCFGNNEKYRETLLKRINDTKQIENKIGGIKIGDKNNLEMNENKINQMFTETNLISHKNFHFDLSNLRSKKYKSKLIKKNLYYKDKVKDVYLNNLNDKEDRFLTFDNNMKYCVSISKDILKNSKKNLKYQLAMMGKIKKLFFNSDSHE